MSIDLSFSKFSTAELTCTHEGCRKPFKKGIVRIDSDGRISIKFTCIGGHENILSASMNGIEPYIPREKAPAQQPQMRTMRCKISGVSYTNTDGTSRQDLLRRVMPGDPIQIIRGKFGSNSTCLVRHAIGILGSVKKDLIRDFCRGEPFFPIDAVVVHTTGGVGEKKTIGCNIELRTPLRPGEEPDVAVPDTSMLQPMSTDGYKAPDGSCTVVYIDKGRRDVYHFNKNCSGMRFPEATTLRHAEAVMRARPCKKCAAGLPKEKGD